MGFVVVTAIALLSQGDGSATPRKAASKQYTVKKSRDSAQGLASSDRKVDHASDETGAPQRVQSLTPDAESKTTRIQVPVQSKAPVRAKDQANAIPTIASIIAESYAADTRQLAEDLLLQALAEAQSPDDESKLHSAIGSLALAQAKPDKEAGLAALRSATESAETPALRAEAAITEASALMVHAESADGLKRIDELLENENIDSSGAQHLKLLRGDLLVEQGDLRAAESAYDEVRKTASLELDVSNDALYRQASLRLSRLYARTGDEKKEALIARELKLATAPKR